MRKEKRFLIAGLYLAVNIFILNFSLSYAQSIPHLISYKGDIKDVIEKKAGEKKEKKDGESAKGRTYNLTFRIYNSQTGGSALWEERQPDVLVEGGEFAVILGSINSLDLRFDEDYWLSIEVEDWGEKAPRERLTSQSYAYMSEDSYKLGGRLPGDYALTGHSHLGEDIVTAVNEAINADMVDGLHASEIGGVKDHGNLQGLEDDDHVQYLNVLRGDSRYAGAGWDGSTKLEMAQIHIADKDNPHAVNLEQLGHTDNNPEEEAPTAVERGEPTGTEIQEWADDISVWGHTNLVTNLNADKVDGKDSTEFSLIDHFHTLMNLSDITSELRVAFLAAGTAGASGTNRLATMMDLETGSCLWADEGSYIYPGNIGSGFQVRDTGNMLIASAGIIDAETSDPKGTLTIGQSLAGNNVDYSLVISRHGTPPNPGIYSHTAPALLIQDFSGTVPSSGRDKDGLLRIKAYRIGDATPNAANVTLLNVNNDEGEALRVDGLRNTFIGYGQKYPTSNQIGSLFVDGNVGIGTTNPREELEVSGNGANGILVDSSDPTKYARVAIHHGESLNQISLYSYGTQGTGLWGETHHYKGIPVGDSVALLGSSGTPSLVIGNPNGSVHLGSGYGPAAPLAMSIVGGNVGIGTTNPVCKLHVYNNNGPAEILVGSNAIGNALLHLDASNGDGYGADYWSIYHQRSSNDLRFWYGHVDVVVMRANGNVGIGTMDPQGKLDVNGAIYQRGTALHADYVFEPGYQLETIEEHAKYMWQEKHLKAVPQAVKAEDGQEIVEVGMRNKGVLEELEKAHIYIAELNERIKQLEDRLKEQN